DFRTSNRLPVQVESRLLDWQLRACRLMPQKWMNQLGISTQWDVPPPSVLECRPTELPKYSVVYNVLLADRTMPTLIVIPSNLAIALVQINLGEAVEKLGYTRELTSIERSILEMLMHRIVEALNTGGNGAGYPTCTLGEYDLHPLMIRIYPNESKLISLRYDISSQFGDSHFQWIWPESLAAEMFLDSEAIYPAEPLQSEDLQLLAMRMQLQLQVALGSVNLSVSELANLSAGDVVVLDQPIAEPLNVQLEDRTIMRAWPTKTGNHQSIQVEECL
ncbi:MAG: FliM/FliN family flagellar motor switch protein, partial [Planctomycetota bacterium]